MTALCRLVAIRIDATVGGERRLRGVEGHIASCLRCQAHRARARRTHRELAALEGRTAPAPAGFGGRVSAAIDGERRRPIAPTASGGHRGAAVTGVAMLAAGGAAVAAWRLVRRPA